MAGLEKEDRKRTDLWCPLPAPINTHGSASVVQHPAAKEYERRMAEAALKSSMTPAEREHLKDGRESQKPRRSLRPRATTEDLLQGAAVLLNKPRSTDSTET